VKVDTSDEVAEEVFKMLPTKYPQFQTIDDRDNITRLSVMWAARVKGSDAG